MKNHVSALRRSARAFVLLAAAGVAASAQSETGKLNVCATVPSLGDIVREVGGDQVVVTTFAKGTENAHFLDARPSFVKTLSTADLFIQQGMDLESGWAPVILQQCRRLQVQPGSPGFLDVSKVVERLEVPTSPVDRSFGDVHPFGNPHFMTDPLNGIAVARAIRDKLAELRPAARPAFESRCNAFEQKVCTALVGEKLSGQFSVDTIMKLARLNESGRLEAFLEQQGKSADLGGWLGAMLPFVGTKAISDHDQWVYFGHRFGIEFVGHLEPKPGISPTSSHLGELVRIVPERGVKLVITSPGFDPRSGEFVASKTGAKLLVLAHEVGAVEAARSYVEMIDYDVKQVVSALQQP